MNKDQLYIYLTQEFKIQFQWLLNTRLASITVSNYQKYFVPIMCEQTLNFWVFCNLKQEISFLGIRMFWTCI